VFDEYCINQKNSFKLNSIDPDELGEWKRRQDEARQKLAENCQEMEKLQEVLYAESKQKILIVFQAMDAGGKDGTIRAVFEGVNPQGVKVVSFKVPTPAEIAHDYLWRVHPHVPGKGEMVIFNRSHYEDVLVVRVNEWIDKKECERRYKHICDFERLLAEEGTTILKFFLHISKDEQRQRLVERINTPGKQWKFNPGDLKERKLWQNYMSAFEDAINQTSAAYAPWYVVPSNRNWYRNLVVSNVIVDTLKGLKMKYPEPVEDLTPYKIQLESEAK
jgi:PPK2 family polyphosphate:nucleotide phosphotransferase